MWSRWYRENWSTLPYSRRSEGGETTSEEGYRRIAATIARLAKIGPGDRVLDLGCSVGAITGELAGRCASITGVDFIEDSLAYAREHHSAPNVEYRNEDLADFEPDGTFDCIVINNVIHMVDTGAIARGLLRRCFEGLSPGGRLYLGEVPDTRKVWRHATRGRKGPKAFAHLVIPGWAFPPISRALGRPTLCKMLWFSPSKVARVLGCPPGWVSAHDEPGTLLNPVERSHFVVTKGIGRES